MHSLLLIDMNGREIPADALQRVFQSQPGFTDVQYNTPTGTPIEARYAEGEDFTTVALSTTRTAVAIRGTAHASLGAAWILSSQLGIPFRMVDTDYSFDLVMRDFRSLAELRAAIDTAQAS